MAQGCHPNGLLLNGEVAGVLASMRSSSRWPPVSSRYEDDELEDPLSEDLKNLRRKLFTWQDWSEVEPLEYLTPFLQVIKSPETSGTVTDVALMAVLKIVQSNMLGDSASGVSEAFHSIAEAVTQCKFEATYPAFDECVLSRILDVLVATVRSPQGRLLTHDNLINIFQACYRIGHYQTEKGRETSELLTQASRRAMADLVSGIFSRVESLPSLNVPVSGRVTPSVLQMGSRLQVSPPASVNGDEAVTLEEGVKVAAAIEVDENGEKVVLKTEETEKEVSAAQVATAAADVTAEKKNDQKIASPDVPTVPSHHEIVSLLSPAPARALTPFEVIAQESDYGVDGGYGIEALCEVLSFVISFVSAPPSRQHTGLPVHGLDLVLAALHAGGQSIAAHEPLIGLLRQDLVKALFSAARGASLACLSGICQVALALYAYLNRHLLLQLEALLSLLLLPMAEGRGTSSVEAQQIALEGVLDFCSQPGFVKDMYLNLDCRIERSNLFEQICTLLSKAAFPVNGPVSAVHVLSLDGIMAILASLGAGCENLVSLDDDEERTSAALVVEAAAEDAATAAAKEPEGFLDIWTPLAKGIAPSVILQDKPDATAAEIARAEKLLKGRLTSVAEHFNRDAKKGFQLCQSLHLLPPTLDPGSVARFLRCCPGLAKPCIGEVLGERDTFYDQVRDAFSETFDFSGLEFDTALRLFMDAFRPPGEGQKIDRIMQTFGKHYYEQNQNGGLKSADAAYVLAFSVIMLNTDLHNTQNKKKMSLKDFNRINDNTNDGAPMPQELLQHIYSAISNDELKISSECAPEELPAQLVFWQRMSRDAQRPRGQMVLGAQSNAGIERDMFALIWGPTLAAVSVILDGSSDPGIARRAMNGLLVAARLATHHGLPDVGDQLLSTLAKYTAVALSADAPKPALVFGESAKGRAAVEATFGIANRYGDSLRGGWRYVLECIVRLHKLGLLPATAIAADGEDLDDASRRFPTPNLSGSKRASSSLFSRAINSLISIEGADGGGGEQATAREEAFMAAAVASADACRVDDLIADSKFLTAESLVELVKATMWAGGNVVAAARTGEGSDTAELALEILITLALRNRDRVALIWPLVHEYIAACLGAESAEQATPLVERAVAGLFRVCQRLLPYKEDTAEMLLASLQLVVGLPQGSAWALAEVIATDVLALVKSSGPYIRTEQDWRTIAALIRMTSARPEAVPAAFEALSVACRDPAALSSESYMPLLETCLQLIDRYKGSHPEAAVRFLDCADALFTWLPAQKTSLNAAATNDDGSTTNTTPTMSDEALVDLWLTSVGVMARGLCREDVKELRDTSIAALHRTLIASAPLQLPAELWVQTTKELLIPLVSDLSKLAASPKAVKARPGLEKSVRLAVNMLTKVLLQYIPLMASDRDFYALWSDALTALQSCMDIKQEAVMESVPENVKNLLMVLASSGVLVPGWSVEVGGEKRNLWELTWSKAGGISSGLNPGMLNAAGITSREVEAVTAVAPAVAAPAPIENGAAVAPQPPVVPTPTTTTPTTAPLPPPAAAVVEQQAPPAEQEEEEAPPASLADATDGAAEYELPRQDCIDVMGGEDVTVIFTADPGTSYGGKGENWILLEQLKNPRNISFPQCWSATSGSLSGNKVLLVTTGEGPQIAQSCAADVLRCSAVIKETLFFGTAGMSPRLGGILNPPKCELPTTNGTLTRPGDICITKNAINFDCQTAPWVNVSINWPEECTATGDPASPFNPQELAEIGVSGYRGWGCFTTPNEGNTPLVKELEDVADSAVSGVTAPLSVQEYASYWWGNQSAALNVDWMPNTAAPPHVYRSTECSEVSSVLWWQGAPFDYLVRQMVALATTNDTTVPTIAASAMESIGFLASIERAADLTNKHIPYAIIRSASDFDMNPVFKAENGSFLQAPSVVYPEQGKGAEVRLAPATLYAIESGTAVILGLMNKRCIEKGNSLEDCIGNNVPVPSPSPASSSSSYSTFGFVTSGYTVAVFTVVFALLV